MVKTLEVKPSVRLVERRVGALTGSRVIATTVVNPGTVRNGARRVKVGVAAK